MKKDLKEQRQYIPLISNQSVKNIKLNPVYTVEMIVKSPFTPKVPLLSRDKTYESSVHSVQI